MTTSSTPDFSEEKQPITLKQFTGLIKKLSPAEISALPLNIMPANIPADIVEQAPAASRAAVEDLLLAINARHLKKRIADAECYGDSIVLAMDRARNSCASATLHIFKNKITDLIKLLHIAKQKNKPLSEESIISRIVSINNLLIDARSENYSMTLTFEKLSSAQPRSEHDKKRFNALIKRIKNVIETTENILGEYCILRLKLLSNIISKKCRAIEANEKLSGRYQKELLMLREELDRARGLWSRTVKRGAILAEEKAVQNRIQELINKINARETPVCENDLMLWLDTIVDVSLNKNCQSHMAESLRTARISLYYLLNHFCKNQEQSAIQIAQNPFIQVDPEQAIRYMLLSEQFILDYFARKKNEKTAWLSGAAANKIAQLDELQEEILAELKRTTQSSLQPA